jgi:hypothetical protein
MPPASALMAEVPVVDRDERGQAARAEARDLSSIVKRPAGSVAPFLIPRPRRWSPPRRRPRQAVPHTRSRRPRGRRNCRKVSEPGDLRGSSRFVRDAAQGLGR